MSTIDPTSSQASLEANTSSDAIPFSRLVRVELRKCVDTVASFWLVASIAILVVIVDGFVLVASLVQSLEVSFNDFTGVAAGVTSLLLPVLGIMLVTSEWSQRTAMVTFTLEPRRLRVVLAKLVVGVVLTALTVLGSIVIGILGTGLCEIVQPDQTTWDVDGSGLTGFFLTQSLAMAGGFALATLLLNTPAAIVLFFVYKWAIPVVLFVISDLVEGFAKVSAYINFLEAQDPLFDLSLDTGEEWAQLVVSGLIWLGLPLALGLWRILRAEVK